MLPKLCLRSTFQVYLVPDLCHSICCHLSLDSCNFQTSAKLTLLSACKQRIKSIGESKVSFNLLWHNCKLFEKMKILFKFTVVTYTQALLGMYQPRFHQGPELAWKISLASWIGIPVVSPGDSGLSILASTHPSPVAMGWIETVAVSSGWARVFQQRFFLVESCWAIVCTSGE